MVLVARPLQPRLQSSRSADARRQVVAKTSREAFLMALFGDRTEKYSDPRAVALGKKRHLFGQQKHTGGQHHEGAKDHDAQSLGKEGGKEGGPARAESLTGAERSAIAKK